VAAGVFSGDLQRCVGVRDAGRGARRVHSGERPDRDYFEFTDFELDLALWRPTLPHHYQPTDPEDEYRNGRYWMTIAIGHGGYFRESARQVAARRDGRF